MPREYIQESIPIINRIPFSQVVFFDNFEDGLLWGGTGNGTDYLVELTTEHRHTGKYGIFMKTRTTGAAADDAVQISRAVPFSAFGKAVFDLVFSLLSGAGTGYMEVQVTFRKAGVQYAALIRYDVANEIWQYNDSAAAWQNISGSNMKPGYTYWNAISIGFDIAKRKYIFFTFGYVTFDLSTYDTFIGSSILQDSISLYITLYTAGAASEEMAVDLVQLSLVP